MTRIYVWCVCGRKRELVGPNTWGTCSGCGTRLVALTDCQGQLRLKVERSQKAWSMKRMSARLEVRWA